MNKTCVEVNLLSIKLVEITSSTGETCYVPVKLANVIEEIENLDIYPDDTWIFGYPKSGTNWVQEMVWAIVNNSDLKRAEEEHIHKRVPVTELSYILPDTSGDTSSASPWEGDTLNYIKNMKRPRIIKSHLPWFFLPKKIRTGEVKPKLIYMERDPKDIAVSSYKFFSSCTLYAGNFDNLVNAFLNNKGLFSPFWSHVNSFKKRQNLPKLLILTFEEMKTDLLSAIKKVAEFLDFSLTNDKLLELQEHLSYESMSKNKTFSVRKMNGKDYQFMGKGVAGGYKSWMTPELIERFQQWAKRNEISGNETTGYDE